MWHTRRRESERGRTSRNYSWSPLLLWQHTFVLVFFWSSDLSSICSIIVYFSLLLWRQTRLTIALHWLFFLYLCICNDYWLWYLVTIYWSHDVFFSVRRSTSYSCFLYLPETLSFIIHSHWIHRRKKNHTCIIIIVIPIYPLCIVGLLLIIWKPVKRRHWVVPWIKTSIINSWCSCWWLL